MTVQELVNKTSQEVRRNPDLMALYIKYYQKKFGSIGSCAGCGFASGFEKLRKAVNSGVQQTKTIKMKKETNNTFQFLNNSNEILTYFVNKKPIRKYKKQADEDFIIGYLINGTKEEIEKRKKLFKVLPESLRSKKQKEVEETAKDEVLETQIETIEPIFDTVEETKPQPKKRGRKSKK